ncbi:hypothetical protein P5V15_007236 [Pogonomyrmex californicus]
MNISIHAYMYTDSSMSANAPLVDSGNVNMAAESGDGLPISPSEKSLTGSLASDENEKSVSRSPSSYSIREDKWPDLVVSRPRKLDAWWLPRREYTARWLHGSAIWRAFQKSGARGLSLAPAC